jgi:hypothetical protein
MVSETLWASTFFIGLSSVLGFGCLDALEQWSPKWNDGTLDVNEQIIRV